MNFSNVMRVACFAAVVGTGLLSGCANLPPPVPAPPPSTSNVRLTQPLDATVGRVISVNPRLKFVVLDYALNELPSVDDLLVLTRAGAPVGELKVTGPRRNSTIVANIVSGDPQPGDQARPAPAAPAPTPAPATPP